MGTETLVPNSDPLARVFGYSGITELLHPYLSFLFLRGGGAPARGPRVRPGGGRQAANPPNPAASPRPMRRPPLLRHRGPGQVPPHMPPISPLSSCLVRGVRRFSSFNCWPLLSLFCFPLASSNSRACLPIHNDPPPKPRSVTTAWLPKCPLLVTAFLWREPAPS